MSETPELSPIPTVEQLLAERQVRFPFILRQVPVPPDHVRVELALPNLKQLHMRVPRDQWLAGEHLRTGPVLMGKLARLLPPVSDDT